MSSISKLILASGSGFFAGLCYHKKIQQSSTTSDYVYEKKLPGLPTFGTVSAASAVVMSPAITEPAVPIMPEKPRVDLIPAEPPKGYSRVAEIMRFGFPGFENIRSRR